MNVDVEIRGMHCASCVSRVEEAARAVAGVRDARVNLASERASIDLDPAAFRAGDLSAALRDRGYRAGTRRLAWRVFGLDPSGLAALEERLRALPGVVAAAASSAQGTVAADVLFDPGLEAVLRDRGLRPEPETVLAPADPEARSLLVRTLVALPLAALVMTLTMTHAAPPWVLAALAAPVHFWAGWPFHAGLLRSLRHLAPDMNALVSLGTNAAFLASPFLAHPWYETSAVIVAVVLLGRLLESRARRGTRRAVESLLELAPRDDVKPGDERVLKPGERVPADGVVIDGAGAVDESMLTGESVPVDKKAGDRVAGGTLNRTGALRVRFDRTGDDTLLARIVRLVRETQGSKPAVQRAADRWAARFVPLVVAVAALTALVWLFLDPSVALACAVSVLVVACPCALGLATPAAVMVGAGRAARLGILFKDADGLEAGAGLRTLVFDKTGTLTEGRPAVVDVVPAPSSSREDVLRVAAAVERSSEHPIARAIVEAAGPGPAAPGFEAFPGSGAVATVDGVPTLVGNPAFLASQGLPPGAVGDERTCVLVAQPGRVLGRIAVADAVRPDAAPAVAELRAMGIHVALLTGDSTSVGTAVARAVGIPEADVRAGVLPDGKAEEIRKLQAGGAVGMVGDGINDAPALGQADLGIAVARGTDVAIESADVVLVKNDLRRVPQALRIARATSRVIRQNFAWAFGYNALLIPLAAGVLRPWGIGLDPRIAAAAMALSSITVVLNALRLSRAG